MSYHPQPQPQPQIKFEPWQVKLLFNVICDSYHKRKLSLEGLGSALRELVVTDSRGRLWTIGAGSGKWYRYSNGRWVEDEPSSPLTPARQPAWNSQPYQTTTENDWIDRRTRRQEEHEEDDRAEVNRRRAGLTPSQELVMIREARPVFMEEFDRREHQRLLRLWKEIENNAKASGARPLAGPYEWYTGPPPKQPWVFDLERYIPDLSQQQLRLYEIWKRSIDSFLRRHPDTWSEANSSSERRLGG